MLVAIVQLWRLQAQSQDSIDKYLQVGMDTSKGSKRPTGNEYRNNI